MSIKRLNALKQRKAAAVEKMNAILAAAGADDLSAEQTAEFDSLKAEAALAQSGIEQTQAVLDAARGMELPDDARITSTGSRAAQLENHGFETFGHYLRAVRGASLRPNATDERLQIDAAAASTYANEASGADGGFLVPPTYSSELMTVIEQNDPLLTRCTNIPVAGNTWVFPVSEETAHGTTGIQAYWDGEAATIAQSKPAFQNREVKLNRLTALCPVTEEALEDAGALGAWINRVAGEKMAFKVTDAILNGTGVGMPQGVVSAPGTVSVAKEGSQVAATIVAENVLKMWARMPDANRRRAVWLAHSDCDVQLPQMHIKVKNVAGSENVGGIPISYTAPSALTGPYALLQGRPIVTVEACAALGTVGDLILADLSQYMAITKGGVRSEQSMHFYFDQNLRTFRFILRVGGQPWLSAPITRKNGTSTQGHFVTLATRS